MKLKILLVTLLLATILPLSLLAQNRLTGKVTAAGEHASSGIPGATIRLTSENGATFDTITSPEGVFSFSNLPQGQYTIEARSMGFKTNARSLSVPTNETVRLALEESMLTMDEVVVTGTMHQTYVSASPVKVEVVTSDRIETFLPAASTSILEGISLINGVQEVVACGVCFTNNISINGLPGAYTAVLMDGSPIYGNLASVYGLNGIPSMLIDRFEVIKGPSSTLYGSEAVAGVINIITKEPASQPAFAVDLMATSHYETFGNLSVAPNIGNTNGFIGVNYGYVDHFDDQNNDGFSDLINFDRVSLFSKWNISRPSNKRFNLSAKYYYEDRRNGVEDYLSDQNYRELRGSDEIYGESIYTHRAELFGTYELPFSSQMRIDYSLSSHKQDSYYGSDHYKASQRIAFTNLIWNTQLLQHTLTMGATARYQTYDDNTTATESVESNGLSTNAPDEQFIPGIFLQDEWDITKSLTSLLGVRMDHYKDHQLIVSPRLSMKQQMGAWTTLRANFGTGFRIVNLFTEDHAFVTGQREVIIAEELEPEESYNGSLNLNHVFTLGSSQGAVDFDAYFTYFTNKITPDYEADGTIVYNNLDGHSVSKGLGLTIQQEFTFPLSVTLGMNVQRVTETNISTAFEEDENNNLQEIDLKETRDIEYAPHWTGVYTANYLLKKWNASLSYSVNVTGPMALPEVFDLDDNGEPLSEARPTTSTPFAIHRLQISKEVRQHLSMYIGLDNVFNYMQSWSPLVGTNDPNAAIGFSDSFDTAYAYSPIHGRELYFGIKWELAKR